MERSHWILDIEHDLRLISERLHALEDNFENDGIIAEMIEAAQRLAEKVKALEAARNALG